MMSTSEFEAVVNSVNQHKSSLLKKFGENVNWEIERERCHFLTNEIASLIREWKDPFPDLLEIFRKEEIERLLNDAINPFGPGTIGESLNKRIFVVNDHNGDTWDPMQQFVEFVIRSGYKNEPDLHENGCPVLHRFTPIHRAARVGKLDLVRLLFQVYDRFDLNYTDDDGYTHLHVASSFNLSDIVEKFLDQRQNPDCCTFREFDSVLHVAVHKGCKEAARLLLRRGADPNLANSSGFTPLHSMCDKPYDDDFLDEFFEICAEQHRRVLIDAPNAAGSTPLHLALSRDLIVTVESLLRNGADPNASDLKGCTFLHVMCQKGYDDDRVEKFLSICEDTGKELRINAKDSRGNTPLQLALRGGYTELVHLLLRRNADPNIADETTLTPLHLITLERDDYGLIETLLRAGADLKLPDAMGATPVHLACRLLKWDLVRKFFEISDHMERPVLINAQDRTGNTALHLALAFSAKIDFVVMLLKRGADPNLANDEGWTPFHGVFTGYWNEPLLEAFFKACDEENQTVNVDIVDESGYSPLQRAVMYLLPRSVDLLLNHGADLSSFVFPTEDQHFQMINNPCVNLLELKLKVASGLMAIVDSLEDKGYQLQLGDALTIMKLFDNYGLFEESAKELLEKCCQTGVYEEEEEEEEINNMKEIMIKPSLSLRDLIRSRPEEAAKVLTYSDYLTFANSLVLWRIPKMCQEACARHLCEKLSRGFFRSWALYPFWELIHYRLPVEMCEPIIQELSNKDLFNICLAAPGRSS